MNKHYNPDHHHRRSIRLRDYDYSCNGAYFVTLVTHNRECLFGEIVDGIIHPNEHGDIVANTWQSLPARYPYVQLDEFVVMPNHMHGIIIVTDDWDISQNHLYNDRSRWGGSRTAPTTALATTPANVIFNSASIPKKPLGRLLGAFKTISSRQINEMRGTPGTSVWQRNYYEHVIRNDRTLMKIRQYIEDNPWNWQYDSENPSRVDPHYKS